MTRDKWITTPVGADMYIYTIERSENAQLCILQKVWVVSVNQRVEAVVCLQTWPIRPSVSDFALYGHKMAVGPPSIASLLQVERKKWQR